MDIVQEVNVEGSAYQNSVVRVTTCIENRDSIHAEVGVRFLWELQIAEQDGPYIGPPARLPPLAAARERERRSAMRSRLAW